MSCLKPLSKLLLKGDGLDPGGKVLHLIEVLRFHWFETLFTHLPEARVPFSCDSYWPENL